MVTRNKLWTLIKPVHFINESIHECGLWPKGKLKDRKRYIIVKNREVPKHAYFKYSLGLFVAVLYKEINVRQTKEKVKNIRGCPIKKKTGVPTVASPGPSGRPPSCWNRKSTIRSLWKPPGHHRPMPELESKSAYSFSSKADANGMIR